ncbi:hypothetical protein ACFQ3W_25080, partial [Paenibacillus puldeungensis]
APVVAAAAMRVAETASAAAVVRRAARDKATAVGAVAGTTKAAGVAEAANGQKPQYSQYLLMNADEWSYTNIFYVTFCSVHSL